MCGICGKVDFTGGAVERGLIGAMAGRLVHRGRDDGGFYTWRGGDDACGLGHRRLSIIDLSAAGRQPMANEDRSLWLVYNGEIYNFALLRRELEAKGHRFSSRTDGEVILHLFEEEGPSALTRLEGMFALALWSEGDRRLLLARDPVGIKPLVYFADGRRLVFASEIKALLADPDVPKEIDPEAVDLYLSLNYIPAPWTILRGVRKLPPGHYLSFDRDGVDIVPYWDVATASPEDTVPPRDFETAKRHLRETLAGAVRRHLIADVPLGAFLSGGIDSSVVVGLMAAEGGRPVKTYTVGYADMAMYDERVYAREVARLHRTDHHEIVLTARDVIAAVPEVLGLLDEPFGDSSAVPTYLVARETARDVKVALSGDGGDELFAGYRLYRGEAWQRRWRLLPRLIRRGLIEPLIGFLPESRDDRFTEQVRRLKKFLRGTKDTLAERFYAWNELFSREERDSLLSPELRAGTSPAPALFAAALARFPGDDLNRMLYADLTVSLPGDMLWKVDMTSMRHPLEVRVPILDRRVCEAAFRIPGEWKLHRGRGKYIFIEAFKDLLPASLHSRPKWGFEMPISRWLKTDLHWLIETYLSRERIERTGLLRPDAVAGLVADLRGGRRDVSWRIWNLIALQAWHENTYG